MNNDFSILTFVIITIILGALMPLQAIINARLALYLPHPLFSALISFLVGSVALILILVFARIPFPILSSFTRIHPVLYTGGILGISFVIGSLVLIPKVGTTTLMISFLFGQLAASLAIDHFGLFSQRIIPLTQMRIMGIVLVFGGLVMTLKKS